MSFEPILLAPEAEPQESYPYRRVWRTGWTEALILLTAVVVIVIVGGFISLIPAQSHAIPYKIAIALLPITAWLLISYRAENAALVPRRGLLGVVVLGILTANGALVPLDERLFVIERWLPQQAFFGRVLGYTFTLGFATQFLKYAVLRYAVWGRHFERRMDGIAYALAVSVGFATVLNMHFALDSDATLSATALRVASITFSEMAISTIIGYYLVELRISRPPVFWIPLGLFLSALISGFYYGFRGVAITGSPSTLSTGSSPVRGLMLAFGLLAVTYSVMAFIISSADTRLEALTGRRQTL